MLSFLFIAIAGFLLSTRNAAVQAKYVHPRNCQGRVKHVHMSVGYGDASTSRIITFASDYSYYTTALLGVIHYGTSPFSLEHRVEQDDITHYDLQNVGNKKANYQNDYYSPYYHHVTLNDLQPETTYYYRITLEDPSNTTEKETAETHARDEDQRQRKLMRWEPYNPDGKPCPDPLKIHSFHTGPPLGSPVSMALVGDLGQFPHSEETVARMERDQYDVAILAGDVAYTEQDHRRWDTFFDFFDDYPLFSRVPLQICPGNHDIDKLVDAHQRDIFLGYEYRFRMPAVKPAELGIYEGDDERLNMDAPPYPLPYEWGNAYYSYTVGMAKVLMISAYSSMEPNSTQYQWIESELNNVDRANTPWLIAVIHTPLYNTFTLHHHDLQIVAAQKNLEPLFVTYGVNLVFSGHIHAYQRTSNVAFSNLNATAPIHITIGAGGRKCEAPYTNESPEEWIEFRDATMYGYGKLDLVDANTALWRWIPTGHADDDRRDNPVGRTNVTVPTMAFHDELEIVNQFYL